MLLTICLMLVPEYAMPIWKNCGDPACQRAAIELTQTPPLPELPKLKWLSRGGGQWCLGKVEPQMLPAGHKVLAVIPAAQAAAMSPEDMRAMLQAFAEREGATVH